MKIYIVANQKGGIGKTTTATAIASILKEKGFKTLLIDADQQGNSTDTFRAKIEGVATLYDVLLETEKTPIIEAIQETEHGLIVASDPLLRKADEILNNDVEGLYILQEALEKLKDYDYVIIDTAPAVNSILHNCLICADEIIIPVTADRYSLQGLDKLNDIIQAIKKRQNPKLKVSGLLLVKHHSRTNLSKEVTEVLFKIAEKMGTKLFKTTIRESVKVKESQAMRTTLLKHAPKSTTTIDYKEFIKELLED